MINSKLFKFEMLLSDLPVDIFVYLADFLNFYDIINLYFSLRSQKITKDYLRKLNIKIENKVERLKLREEEILRMKPKQFANDLYKFEKIYDLRFCRRIYQIITRKRTDFLQAIICYKLNKISKTFISIILENNLHYNEIFILILTKYPELQKDLLKVKNYDFADLLTTKNINGYKNELLSFFYHFEQFQREAYGNLLEKKSRLLYQQGYIDRLMVERIIEFHRLLLKTDI